MNLESRLNRLEHRMGVSGEFLLIVICAGCRDEAKVTGYAALMGERRWKRQAGESLDELKARIEASLKREALTLFVVRELYPDECHSVADVAVTGGQLLPI